VPGARAVGSDGAAGVPTQLDRGTDHAARRSWPVVATFKDDGYSAFKEITRDGFGELIAAIEAGRVDVVIVRDIDRLTRNLTDWNAFEKACVRHGVRLLAYTGGDLDLSTAEGAYYGGMETLRARRESAVKSARVREAQDREARKGRRTGGGQRWFGYTGSMPTRTSRTTRSGTSCVKRSTRSKPTRSGTRSSGYWSTGMGRLDRAGLDRARYHAGRGQAVVADLDRGHADLGAAGWAAEWQGKK
jgi:DNA invertase Pin-like site-specific DNA recombinase